MNVLYITYDGITDHIGQSQVAPYLIGLASKGHRIALLSAEKMERKNIIVKYEKLFAATAIEWHYIPYHKRPPVLSTVLDLSRMNRIAKKIVSRNKVNIIHCRSYVASLIGLHFKKKYGIPFIFDMRDFWPDAGKEIKRFDVENNRVHKAVYQFFKKKEREFIEQAAHIVSLTESGKRVMQNWNGEGYVRLTAPISVIPCCADFDFYNRLKIDSEKLQHLQAQLGIKENDFVLGYVGSLGKSYLIDEMMDVFKRLLIKKPNAKFLIVANNDHKQAREAAERKGIDLTKVIIKKASKEEVPYFISLFYLSVFFYYTDFSRKACSPTRLAELFAMNVPVISNSGVGDLDELLKPKKNASTVIHSFSFEEYDAALDKILPFIEMSGKQIRENSDYFTLTRGIELYNHVYENIRNLNTIQ